MFPGLSSLGRLSENDPAMALPREKPPALDTSVPFTRAEARAAGLGIDLLRGRSFHRVLYDLYVAASTPLTPRLLAQAVLRIAPPGAYVSHHTAAKLWGGVVPDVCETHLTVPRKENRLDRAGVRSHVPRAAAAPSVELRGVRLSSPVQTFLDLAASGLNLVDLVVLGDSLVKRRRTTPDALIEAANGWSHAGGKVARRAARYVRDGVDSPQESRLRMLLVLAGLPEPRVNRIVRSPIGAWLRRFDMSYDEYDVLVEYDGRQHAESVEQWLGDIARREELDGMNLRIIVVTSHGIFDEPARTLTRVRDILKGRGARVPTVFRPEWQRYFPGRA